MRLRRTDAVQGREWIVKAAHARGLNLKALAKRAGVSQRTMAYLLAGQTNGRMPTRRALLGALGLPLEEHLERFGPLRRKE